MRNKVEVERKLREHQSYPQIVFEWARDLEFLISGRLRFWSFLSFAVIILAVLSSLPKRTVKRDQELLLHVETKFWLIEIRKGSQLLQVT